MIKRVVQSPVFAIGLFVLGAVLLLVGGIGSVQAAPRIQSADWRGEVELTDISTCLLENGSVVASHAGEGDDVLLGKNFLDYKDNKLKPDGSNFQVGKAYAEELAVQNDGRIDEYVRVTVTKYWEDKGGNKDTSLDPSLIDLHFVEGDGWTIDNDASTTERTVLYYSGIVAPGAPTPNFTDTIAISSEVQNNPAYDGRTFRIKAVVDAVQTHNADPAKISAWGTKG